MAKRYRPVDRDQSFLLPPSMVDWLPEDHLVWFVIAAIERLDTSRFHARARRGGVGRQGFDPDMLLTLWVYAMALGQRSSRQIERLCQTDVAFRIICAGDVPDHTVLARFRRDQQEPMEELLTATLRLCAVLGMVRLGVVALDGTKIPANAAKDRTLTETHLRELARAQLAAAAATDDAEDALFGTTVRGDELPEAVRDRTHRGARISQALAVIEARRDGETAAADERAQAAGRYVRQTRDPQAPARGTTPKSADPVAVARARYERERERAQQRHQAYLARAAAAAAAGRKPDGRRPATADEHPRVRRFHAAYQAALAAAATAEPAPAAGSGSGTGKANLTDPDSRLLKTRTGFVQGYNCQTAVSDDHFIVHTRATQDTNDLHQFRPTLAGVTDLSSDLASRCPGHEDLSIGILLADAGYDSHDNLTAPGPDRLIANAKGRTLARNAAADPAVGDPPEPASARERMDHRLRTPDGLALYAQRSAHVEAPNAWLKDGRGLRSGFARRGLPAAQSELCFAAAVTNLLRLFTLGITAAALAAIA